jgi:hypothetical protein
VSKRWLDHAAGRGIVVGARLLGEALEDRAPCRVAKRRESVKSVSHNAP